MLDALTITDAEAAGLSRLAALDLAMAEDFAARARDERDPEIANDLGRSYQRMARSYRQTLALKVRLAREIAAAERANAEAVPREEPRIRERALAVREGVVRVIWAEQEAPDSQGETEPLDPVFGNDATNRLTVLLDERLALAARDNRFGLQPLDDHVLAVCADLGLDPGLARQWRDLPDPDELDFGAEPQPAPEWRGSG